MIHILFKNLPQIKDQVTKHSGKVKTMSRFFIAHKKDGICHIHKIMFLIICHKKVVTKLICKGKQHNQNCKVSQKEQDQRGQEGEVPVCLNPRHKIEKGGVRTRSAHLPKFAPQNQEGRNEALLRKSS